MKKNGVFPYITAPQKMLRYDESYFDTHTNGIDDRLLIAAGRESELAVWKKLERRRVKLSLSKRAFLGSAGAWYAAGMPFRGLIMTLIAIVLAEISVLNAMGVSESTPEMAAFLEMEPPRYTLSEVNSLLDAQTADFTDIEKRLFTNMRLGLTQNAVTDNEMAGRYEKYCSIVNGKTYKKLVKDRSYAMEYEQAKAAAERTRRLILKPASLIFLYILLFGFNFLTSLFFNHAHSQSMRKKILCVMASREVIESEAQFRELLNYDSRKRTDRISSISWAIDLLYYCFPMITIAIKFICFK